MAEKKKEEEEESNCLTMSRKINRMLRWKWKSKIRMNGEGLACLEGPADSGRTLIMMMILV